MISSGLEGTGRESRVAGWAAGATIDDAVDVRAVIEAGCRSSFEGAAPASSESATRIRALSVVR